MPEMRMKSLAINCGQLSENDPRFNTRVPLFGPFQNDLDVGLGHRLPQIPMNQETAVAVQDAAQVVERRANVPVGNFNSGPCRPFFAHPGNLLPDRLQQRARWLQRSPAGALRALSR
jgi:hypothetical protein